MTHADTERVEPSQRSKVKRNRTHWLYMLVIVGVVAGIVVGLLAPDTGKSLGVLGELFVKLIKMMIIPVIFCTVVIGIGKLKATAVGKVGGLALAYFLAMSTVALGIGLVVGNLISPGTGLNIPADPGKGAELAGEAASEGGPMEFISDIIPTTLFSAVTEGNVLQALFVALLVGFAIQTMGSSGVPLLRGVELLQKLVFRILIGVLWIAPIGRIRCDRRGGRCHRIRRGDPARGADVGVLYHLHHLRIRCAWRGAVERSPGCRSSNS